MEWIQIGQYQVSTDFLPSSNFQGRAPDDFRNGGSQHHSIASPATSNDLNGNLPNLKPNERAGRCQRYSGSVCQEHLGNKYIYVSQGLTLDYIERQLQKSLMVIKNSPDLSKECAKYAIPAICLSTLPLCDTQIQKPRKVNNNVFLYTYLVLLLFEYWKVQQCIFLCLPT